VNLGSPQPIAKHSDHIEALRHIGRLSTEQPPKDPLIPLGLGLAGVLAKDGISDPVVFEMACRLSGRQFDNKMTGALWHEDPRQVMASLVAALLWERWGRLLSRRPYRSGCDLINLTVTVTATWANGGEHREIRIRQRWLK